MAKILLLQSDDQLAGNYSAFLSRRGFDVITHKDPQAAVMDADAGRADLVILDLLLAGRSAAEFLYELRSYPDWQDVPVIVLGDLFLNQMETYLETLNQLNVSLYLNRQTAGLDRLIQEIDKLLPVTQ